METPTIEQEIAQLEKQIQEKKASLGQKAETKEEMPAEKEILREVVGEKIQQQAPAYQVQAKSDDKTSGVSYLLPELKEKIQELINIVFNKSLNEGISEAVKSQNPALIDAFHDVLVDELYDALVERKKLEQPK